MRKGKYMKVIFGTYEKDFYWQKSKSDFSKWRDRPRVRKDLVICLSAFTASKVSSRSFDFLDIRKGVSSPGALKFFGPRTSLHSSKLSRVPRSFGLYGLELAILTMLETETEKTF